jgi:sodium transport system permease protein
MNLHNTRLIFRREVGDQWRDRRTLFTIVVMPLVLYPLMGMAMLQTAQFLRRDPPRILLIDEKVSGESTGPDSISRDRGLREFLNPELFNVLNPEALSQSGQLASLLDALGNSANERKKKLELIQWMKASRVDLIVRMETGPSTGLEPPPVSAEVFASSASETSAQAANGVSAAFEQWQAALLRDRLAQAGLPVDHNGSARIRSVDLAAPGAGKNAMWAKILPFIVMVWALTGAFYPAIDLCAGEKERGTMETLLCSTALRSEIVAGKLLTVITFSIMTAVLNLFSMTATGLFVMGKLSSQALGGMPIDMGLPPLTAIPWLIIGILPGAALFSSLALALASFARSSREGQYYLIPLLMSLLPLMMLSMFPGTRMELGTSLIPVTGLLLLMRNLMLGEFGVALNYAGPVLAVTLICCWLAGRWAVFQFNNESVLFRSGDQYGLSMWFRHLVRDRGPLPGVGEAALCGVLVLVIKFFVGLAAEMPSGFAMFARQTIIAQVATIALPAVLMAMFLTRGPRETLRLHWSRFSFLPACILLAILLHPGFVKVSELVMYLYPASSGLQNLNGMIQQVLADAPGPLAIIAVIAIVPAICEELAFRGFILSGLQSIRGRWTAIFLSAAFFGIAHGILQQSIMATLVGIVLGIISVQTRSLFPCIAYHATHNAMPILLSCIPATATHGSWLGVFLRASDSEGMAYTGAASVIMPIAGFVLLFWLWRFSDSQWQLRERASSARLATA